MSIRDISWELFLVGLGLFLFGVVLMGDGLKSLAGDKLREYIDRYTSKPIQGILVGAIITALIQSSSATTAITIGFIRAGLMSLEQAAGIIIGANIGSTITSFLIGLNISGIAPYFVVVGAFILLFSKDKKMTDIANILVGFGVLFYGIDLIGDTLSHLKEVEEFAALAALCDKNPFVGLAIGLVMTVAMQSSAAAIGVIQIIYVTGAISFNAVLPFLFGSNIGTCITAIMASMGGNAASKRAAVLHTTFNIIGSVLGMLALKPLSALVLSFDLNPMMQIAMTHIIFNTATAILVFPFINKLCAFVRLVIKGEEPKKKDVDVSELDPQMFPVPSAALAVAYKALQKEKDLVIENVECTCTYFLKDGTQEDFDNINENEELINKLDHSITSFLTNIKTTDISDAARKDQLLYLEINKNLERMGDLSVNVAEFAKMVHEEKGTFTMAAYGELDDIFKIFFEMIDITFLYVDNKDPHLYSKLLKLEDQMDTLEEEARSNHFHRMTTKECTSPVASSVYADILSNLERMGDHCCNIAKNIFINEDMKNIV